ncbi:competence/damage-inducible protein A [Blautia liquoris]|uniref:Putative competence-damage inducible protein n=1 Tax=Blautia liquoris TaxID=2779518 RepID=A0A7M2RJZ3_9FIRM|nr:competence/damage-inducible protein A [Blautia liquoris]QOV20625.1 competence/damage-inducible protein A [Blautia liquoris]
MTVEIISVGTEILLGNIVNTNAAYLSRQCAALGLSCYYQVVVGDNEARMAETMKTAIDRSDVVICSGGLGPTEDDMTKEVACSVMGERLVEDAETHRLIEMYMGRFVRSHRGYQITENNWKQAMVPEHGIVLKNDNGTAPGLIIDKNQKIIVLLPGPPSEMKPLFDQQVFPYLQRKQSEVIYSTTLKIVGSGESYVEMSIRDLIDTQTNPTIATYAKTGEVHLRLTAKAENEKKAKELITPVRLELEKRFETQIYTEDEEETLEMALVRLLYDHNLTVTTAESCTGGAIAARIVNVSGASSVFRQGYITYANEAKQNMIGVKGETLTRYGAVSEQTAREMSEGAACTAGCDCALSVTGIAGPTGGTKEKPVGLVYIGCTCRGKTSVKELHFSGNRGKIREQTVVTALAFLRECILNSL